MWRSVNVNLSCNKRSDDMPATASSNGVSEDQSEVVGLTSEIKEC